MFLQQLDMVLGRKAVLSKGQKCARKVIHLYDELGNIPPIPKLGARLTGGPGMNLLYTLVIRGSSRRYYNIGWPRFFQQGLSPPKRRSGKIGKQTAGWAR